MSDRAWPRPLNDRERADEYVGVIPPGVAGYMDLARRALEDRQRLKLRVRELEGWIALVAKGYGPHRDPKDILDDTVAEAKRLIAGQPAVEPPRRRPRYRWDQTDWSG